MKIIGIIGSPRKIKGNTGRLTLEVLKAAQKEGAELEYWKKCVSYKRNRG